MKNRPSRNLYKEAFINQYNLILLGFAGAASLVTLSPIPLLAAAGLELLYIGFVAETDLFQRYVDRKYLALDMEEARAQMEERLKLLDSDQRRRYERITTLIEETKQRFDTQGAGLGDPMIDKLQVLNERFLWMMETANSYQRYLNDVDQPDLLNSLADVELAIEQTNGRVQASLKERRDILKKRLNRLERVMENHIVVNNQIATVEDIMRLIYESSMSMTDPRGISQQVDDLLVDLESTEETLSELDRVDDANETELAFDEELELAIQEAHEEAKARS